MPILFVVVIIVPILIGILYSYLCKYHKETNSILLFHSVTDSKRKNLSQIKTDVFSNFIEKVAKNRLIASTISEMANNHSTISPQLCIVFDDGFANIYENAFPIMQKFGMVATIFPIINGIGTVSSWDVYKNKQRHCTKEEILEMFEAGFEIGSHTLSHPDLSLLSNSQIEYELKHSRAQLSEIINRNIYSFSFPYGSWNSRIWKIAQQCGYSAAVAYCNTSYTQPPIFKAIGTYAFDTTNTLYQKATQKGTPHSTWAIASIMPQFAKGSALWEWRKEYNLKNIFKLK